MKIAICALLVVVAYAGQILPLSGLGAAPANPAFTLTSAYPAAPVTPTVTAFSGISAYAAGATPPAIGAVSITVTYPANLNQSVFVGVSYPQGNNANAVQFTGVSSTTSAGLTTDVYTNTGSTQSFRFDVAGTYGAVAASATDLGFNTASLSFPGSATGTSLVVTGNYAVPSLSAFTMISPSGCTTTGCTNAPNATGTIAPVLASNWYLKTNFRATNPTSSGVFSTGASCDANSVCNFDSPFALTWTGSFGGFVNGAFVAQNTLSGGNTLVPAQGAAAGSAIISDNRNFYATVVDETTFGSRQGPITFPIGSPDIIPPTCTSAIFVPSSATTVSSDATAEFAIICADTGGSGLYRKGAFGQANRGSFTQYFDFNQPASATSVTESFPAYVSGSLEIIGVWAVDNALNSVLYGSCGGVTGYSTIGCSAGSGSSSASTVSMSIFALFSLVVMALFA